MWSNRRQQSRRQRRNNRRGASPAALNLISLMDIFTILVFFLLVSQAASENLPKDENFVLPESISEIKPKETVHIVVTKTQLIVENKLVANIQEIEDGSDSINALRLALEEERAKVLVKTAATAIQNMEVTILADKSIAYSLLKKVMNTATKLGYNKIALAVNQRALDAGDHE